MPFYATTKKNGWIIVHLFLNLLYADGYVHDIFVLFLSKEYLQSFVDYMNKQHRCIKFTSETEKNNAFAFLDINVTRQNNLLIITSDIHLIIQKLLSVESNFHFAISLFAWTTHYSFWKLKN